MINRDYQKMYESYKKQRINENLGGGLPELRGDLPSQERMTGIMGKPNVEPVGIEVSAGTLTPPSPMDPSPMAPIMGGLQSLIPQVMGELERAINLTKQEIDIVRNILEKAKFEAPQ